MAREKSDPTQPSGPEAEPAAPPEAEAGESSFPVVGIGASAGGLEAYQQLLRALPADTGMAFVLVPHLDPTHASILSEILARVTTMPVREVQDEPAVEPDHVYVLPPGRDMAIAGGVLKLLLRQEARGQHRPIDTFLRALAEDQGHRAVGVILSGTGSDGTLGLEAIKAEGGITFAQDETAQHDGMPRSASAAGCVDHLLPPARIAEELARIGRHRYVAPAEDTESGKSAISQVLRRLRDATGVDFALYRSSTLYRRITRRMLLHKLEGLPEYLRLLQGDAGEVQALYQDILISVTSFFRDPDAFEALKATVFPRLTEDRPQHDPARIWVLGCSTGEEAYSLAIALAEFAEEQGVRIPAQVFATDLNEKGIEKARAGLYPRTIAQDVSPERLRRFFAETAGGYQVSKAIRELCVFARQNVLADPPFSRMDLISCRNLLIYLEPVLQNKIVPLLHYALRPGGFLWLGGSETVGTFSDLFKAADAKHKIYAKKPGTTPAVLHFPMAKEEWQPLFLERPRRPAGEAGGGVDVQREADRLAVAKYAPPGVVVNADLDILQFRGDTSAYLAPAPGKPSVSLLKMAREGLLVGLRAALQKALKEGVAVRQEGLRVKANGGMREVNLEVLQVGKGAGNERYLLVLFEEAKPAAGIREASRGEDRPADAGRPPELASAEEAERQVARLTQELAATREYLQALIEEQEAANEELQSANEEVQSSNEELESLNEELQTSKEEIQSANEELATVNDELRDRNDELKQATSDLTNFLSSIHQALVMLGPDLRIRRFTPQAEKLLNLIAADVGRPIGDIRLVLGFPDLEQRLAEVIDSVVAQEHEVQDRQGRWYSLRLRPYKTLDNRIDGAVLVLVEIDAQKRAQAVVQEAREYAESIVATVREPLLVLDGKLRVQSASRAFYRTFEVAPAATEGRLVYQLGNGQWDIPELRRLLGEVLPRDNSFDDFVVEHEFERIGRRTMQLNGRRLVQENTRTELILLAIEDVTERNRMEKALRESIHDLELAEQALQDAHRRKDEFLATLSHELRNPLAPLRHSLEVLHRANADRAAVEQGVGVMERQVRNLTRLVDDLLDVSRISHGKIELRKEPVDLVLVAPQAVESVRHHIDARSHELSVSLAPAPVYVEGDPIRLEQVVANLLSNAAKYTDPGGRIGLTLERGGPEAVLSVRDTGIGIAPEMLPRVFDRFTRADTSYARERGGLGIGLSLVRELVEMHGGSVQARSAGLGQGSEFVVRLPLLSEARVKDALPGQRRKEQPSPERPALRILVVEDNADAAQMLAVLLRVGRHQVQVAHNGPAALEAAAGFRPEVVLLDIGLPGMDGYEVARHLRRQPGLEQATLVAFSGYGQAEDRRRSEEAGFDAHLVKPVDPEVLQTLLARADRARRQ